jgi:hypothetical protein
VNLPPFIERPAENPYQDDFKSLRKYGIALLQDLSAQHWTDFNLHDPGVTMLELLCHGLTDLAYRTGFDVADYLSDKHDQLDYHDQALFPAQDIFPSAVVTNVDMCKLIYDQITEVDDVWITTPEHNSTLELSSGLLIINLKLHESIIPNSLHDKNLSSDHLDSHDKDLINKKAELKQRVLKLLAKHRSLCQDIVDIKIVPTCAYSLAGEIEIDSEYDSANLFANIYFECAKEISSDAKIRRYADVFAQDVSWEELLTGPATEHGYLEEHAFYDMKNDCIDVVKLIKLIRKIPGVKQVKKISFIDQNGQHFSSINSSDDNFPVLKLPQNEEFIQSLKLVYRKTIEQNVEHDLSAQIRPKNQFQREYFADIRLLLRKFEFEYSAFRNNQDHVSDHLPLPKGKSRPLYEYKSIGEHSPAIYGINHFGVPKSYPAAVRASAMQLKAYLFPFEQLMANYLQSLYEIRELHSLDQTLQESYATQYLGDKEIPNIKDLYTHSVSIQELKILLRSFDDYVDRKDRLLDSMLAMYADIFPNKNFLKYYVYEQDEVAKKFILIRQKTWYLQHLCQLSRDRAYGFNTFLPYADKDNYSVLQKKVYLLIGCATQQFGRYLSSAFSKRKLKVLSHAKYKETLFIAQNFSTNIDQKKLRELTKRNQATASKLNQPPHTMLSKELLCAGIYLENYRLLKADDTTSWLCFLDHDEVLPLIRLPDDDALEYAYQLHAYLVELNLELEGFHLVEHVLLRQRSKQDTSHDLDKVADYAHQLSIVLPMFTGRFSSPDCRSWIESVICKNLPAHVLPKFYWLSPELLFDFEQTLQKWHKALHAYQNSDSSVSDPTHLNDASMDLLEKFKKLSPYTSSYYWV